MAKTAFTDDVVSKRAYHRSTSHIYCMHIWIELLADWYGHTSSTFHKLDYYQYVRQVQSTFGDDPVVAATFFFFFFFTLAGLGRGASVIRFESNY